MVKFSMGSWTLNTTRGLLTRTKSMIHGALAKQLSDTLILLLLRCVEKGCGTYQINSKSLMQHLCNEQINKTQQDGFWTSQLVQDFFQQQYLVPGNCYKDFFFPYSDYRIVQRSWNGVTGNSHMIQLNVSNKSILTIIKCIVCHSSFWNDIFIYIYNKYTHIYIYTHYQQGQTSNQSHQVPKCPMVDPWKFRNSTRGSKGKKVRYPWVPSVPEIKAKPTYST